MPLAVFPALSQVVAFPVKRTPGWSTIKSDALSGKRVRGQQFSYPIYRYELTFKVLRTAAAYLEWQTLQGFINQQLGGAGLWLYDDVNDDAVATQRFGTGDGAATDFQLVRTLGGFTEPVFFPTVTGIEVDGVTKTLGTDYTVGNYGVITFAAPPNGGAVLTWDGTFYWGCRFDDDQFEFEAAYSGIMNLRSLKFSTEKLP
jgi:uncharacterized protein (TIGR02217 family)